MSVTGGTPAAAQSPLDVAREGPVDRQQVERRPTPPGGRRARSTSARAASASRSPREGLNQNAWA